MVKAIRECSSEAILDLHMCVYKPARFVEAMQEAGADRFIFQFESMDDEAEALDLAKRITDAGMKCGISINPSTSADSLDSILASGLISVVNLLAVEPGFGGQKFNPVILEKIAYLLQLRREKGYSFEIGVDGKILHLSFESASVETVLLRQILLLVQEGSMKRRPLKSLRRMSWLRGHLFFDIQNPCLRDSRS